MTRIATLHTPSEELRFYLHTYQKEHPEVRIIQLPDPDDLTRDQLLGTDILILEQRRDRNVAAYYRDVHPLLEVLETDPAAGQDAFFARLDDRRNTAALLKGGREDLRRIYARGEHPVPPFGKAYQRQAPAEAGRQNRQAGLHNVRLTNQTKTIESEDPQFIR